MGGPPPPLGREDGAQRGGQTHSLHGKEVTLRNGRTQRIFSFAREPEAGAALDARPPGRAVVENPRTGLPFLKGATTAPAAGAPAPGTAPPATAAGAQRTSTRR